MHGKSNYIRVTPALAGGARERKPFFFVLFIFILALATPVLADYLGPNRTVTETTSVCKVVLYECQYVASKDLWKYKKVDDWSCSNEGKPWQGVDNYDGECGPFSDGRTQWGKEEILQTVTTTHPEATIASALQGCNLNNGWCNTTSELSLNGTEPLSGYSILAVEGSLNGQTFACSGDNCSVSLNEGNNDFTFWALSSWGDSSSMGTFSAKVDTVLPTLGLNITTTSGSNGWYVSPTSLTATGSDSTSGLSSVFLSVDNGAWIPSTTLNEGVYNVLVQAEDNAGNISSSSTIISVDTTTPTVDVSVNGTIGSNGWYSSGMQVSATANDATSGVGSLEASLDGGGYQAYNSPVSFADGYHTVQFKAVDNAGNETETSAQEFYVDTIAPAIDLPAEWEVNDTITYKVQDDGSGLSALRVVIEDEDEKFAKVAWNETVSGNKFKGEIIWNGKFKDGTVAPPGEYLVWIKAKDQAGNERFGLGRVIVPQPTVFSLLQPTTTNNQETLLPPQELFDEDELPITNPSATTTPQQNLRFGESITDPKESSQTSLSLATGTSSASTTTNSNILWGATAAALIGWATATALEEKKKRKALHRASRDEAEQVKALASRDEESPLTRQEKELAKQRKELQKLWDANGAAIYEANREYQAKHGKEMDAATRSKAIKDATVNGVFHAGAYASNLEAEQTRQDAQNERMANKMTRLEQEEEARWQASQKAAEEKKAQVLQDGLAAYYAATRQGEQEVKNSGPKVSTALARDDDPPWWEKLIEAGKKVIDDAKEWVSDHVVQPAKETVNKAITTVKNFVTTVKETYQTVKNAVKLKWEDAKQWAYTNIVQPAKDTFNRTVTNIKLHFSPVASLNWNTALRQPKMFAQDQMTVGRKTGPAECVTTTVVVVRNIMNEYLANLSNKTPLPDLAVKDYASQTDSLGKQAWLYRVPTNVPPLPIINIDIGGWMHPKLQMERALNEFASQFESQYGCSYTIEQSSRNSYLDIARNLREGNLVIIHGMWDTSDPRAWIGGAPHTMGPVVEMDAKNITLVNTDGKTLTMTKEKFKEFWGQSSQVQIPGPKWLPEWLRPKLPFFYTYTKPNTMTVVIPDTTCSPANTP
ncbi:MAG: hypothetical protein CNIPEHKO_02432 [Anaerolineales bacterium]|nr:hypothetical protein [Anaerolineales bacterium]